MITDDSSDSEVELYKQIPGHDGDTHDTGEPTFTAEQGVEAIGFGWFQIRLYVICGLFTVSTVEQCSLAVKLLTDSFFNCPPLEHGDYG